jgi:DNA topoisomerase-1
VFAIGVNRAVTLLADKRAGKGGGRFGKGAAARQVLKDLGAHPSEGGKIEVLSGRYGPYVSHNKVNATVPRSKDPASLTVDEAVALLAERIANGGGKKPAKKAAKPKATKAKSPDEADTKPAAKSKAKSKAATSKASAKNDDDEAPKAKPKQAKVA